MIKFKDVTEIIAHDIEGYKYKITLYNLQKGKTPNKFMKNPYAIENVKLFLSIHYPSYQLLDNHYVNVKTKMQFLCLKHKDKGVQLNTINNIVNNHHACKYCSYEQMRMDRIIDESIIIKRANELKLNYIDRFTKNNETWINFVCPKHEEKEMQSSSWYHFKTCAKGCAYCVGKYKTTDDFKEEMNKINPNIKILGKYKGSENPIKCRCKICNHIWSPIGRSLKSGQGCPNCSTSKGELRVKEFLDKHDIKYIQQKTFDGCLDKQKLKFDFYLPVKNIAIEYDGQQHFMPVDFANKGIEWATNMYENNARKDKIKNNYCKNNNIKLIRIPYYNYDNIFDILTSELGC